MADDMVDVPTMEDDDKALEDEKPTSDTDDDDNKHNGEEKKVEEGTTDETSDVVETNGTNNGQFASNDDSSSKEEEVKDDKEDEEEEEDEPKEKLEQKVSIISVSDLASELNTYQIVDTRTRAKFIEGHIPGSYHMEWEDWTYRCPKRIWNKFGLGRPTLLSRVVDERHVRSHHRLQLLNLNTSKPIVVVGEPFEWGADGRVAWNLLFWGCTDVCLLDGGYPKWENEQKDHIETGILSAPTLMHPYSSRRSLLSTNDEDSELTFNVNYQDERRATTIDVHMLMARDNDSKQTPWYPLLIDTRSKEEYAGTIKMPNQRRIGRIAKSVNIPASKLYHKDGTFIGKDELHELLLDVGNKDGSISEDEHAIAYCTAGVRSGLLSVLAEALLGLHIKNYDASLWEWACNPNNLMETGNGEAEHTEEAEAAYDDNKVNQVDSTTDVDDIIGDLKGKKSEDRQENGEE